MLHVKYKEMYQQIPYKYQQSIVLTGSAVLYKLSVLVFQMGAVWGI